MRILVTGATGFLGSEIVRELEGRNFDIIQLARAKKTLSAPNRYYADISDSEEISRLAEIGKTDCIIHSAGLAHQFHKIGREEFFRINAEGTRNILKLGKELQISRFLLISSVAVYGKGRAEVSGRYQEDNLCYPEGDYAESKREAERIAEEFCRENGIKLTILRPATIIGENDPGNVMRLIKTIEKRRFFWIGDGSNLKSLVYKGDVANACAKLLEAEIEGEETFNISAPPISMKEIVGIIADELEVNIPKVSIPNQLARSIGKFSKTIDKWLSDDTFSAQKIEDKLGFKSEISIREALRREIKKLKKS